MPIHSLNAPISGMRVAQRNLTVTGHNMANVNTPGFSRQRVNQSDHFYRSMGLTATHRKEIGLGTDILSIQQLRDQFLDQAFRHQIGRANYYNAMWNTSNQIESVMRELLPTASGTSGIQATRNIWNSIQELTTNPRAVDHRVNFVSSARTYLERMTHTFNQLQQQQQVLNNEIKDTVARANELIVIINNMNREISRVEIGGQNANDFRDTRELAMEELSSILDVNITFNRNGHAEISTNGMSLLSGGHITYIGLRFTGNGTNFVEPVIGQDVRPGSPILAYDPTFSNARSILRFDRTPNHYERPALLLGLVTSRGLGSAHHASQTTENPYEAGATPPLDAYALFQWQVRRDFNANVAIIPRTIRHLDVSFNHMVTMINEFITNQNASTDRSTWGFWNDPLANSDDATINMVTDSNRQQTGIPLFVTRDPDLIQNADPAQVNGFTLNYTLGNVIINPMLLAPGGYAYLGFAMDTLSVDDTTVLQNLLGAWQYNNVSIDGSLEMNVDNLWNHIVTYLATETKALEDASYNQNHRVRNLDTARQRAFGVSLDEELSNMMRFQHSFNASARLVNIIDSMIDTLINRTGRG
ncbi:MAG: hypothetical protein FWE02_05450 [Defluviitaleaceae bacterium]|nr:hypothetical protein [Defluviitaleaceae bacterium]